MKLEISNSVKIALTLTSALFLAHSGALAQDSNEEVFELSPFQVDASGDVGYTATSTLTGSRLNTRLEDVAASVSVFTEEFLTDTGLSDLQDLALYSVGTRNDSQDTSASGDDNDSQSGARVQQWIRLRGILGTKGLDYFQSFVPDDSYRAARYDESRGPNGILFGISDPGGIVNTSTLRANTRFDKGKLRYSVDNYGRNRFEGQYNKVLIDKKLGITLAGLYQDNDGWRDYVFDSRERVYGAIMWQPTEKLSISINGETGTHSNSVYRKYAAADGFSAWVDHGRQTFTPSGNNPSTAARAAGVVASYGSGERVIYVANDEFGDPYYYQGGRTYFTASYEDNRVDGTFVLPGDGDIVERMARIIDSEEFPYPRDLNAVGPGSFRDTDFDTITVNVDYNITKDIAFNIAHNYQNTLVENTFTSGNDPILRGDPNNTILNPSQYGGVSLPNPYAKRLFFESFWRNGVHSIDYNETRAALSWDIDLTDSENNLFKALGRHRLAAGYSYREVSDYLVDHYLGFLGAPFNSDHPNSENRLITRNYITEGDFSTYRAASPPAPGTTVNILGLGTQEIGWINQNWGTSNVRADTDVESLIVALQSNFWDDRITTTIGWREDTADNLSYGYVEDPIYGDTISTDPTAKNYRDDAPVTSNTKTAGIVFDVTQNLSLVANYATSIGLPQFRDTTLPNSGIPEPVDGEGYDLGIQFFLLDGKISGRLVYYEAEQIGLTTSGGITRIVRDPMQDSMNALDTYRAANGAASILNESGSPYSDAAWDALVAELGPQVTAVYQDVESSGWELTMTANLTENWRLNFNASYTDRDLNNYGREFLKLAGYQLDDNGLAIQAVTLTDFNDQTTATVDLSKLQEGGLHRRILELANRVVGYDATTFLTNADSAGNSAFDVDNASVAYQMYDSISVLNYEKSIREGRLGLNPWKFNVFTAYDFSEGKLEGFSIGGGIRYLGGKIMGTDESGSEIKSPSATDVDLMLRYRQKIKKGSYIDYQINVYNAFNEGGYIPERHVILARTSTPLSRYEYRDPRHIRLTVSYSF